MDGQGTSLNGDEIIAAYQKELLERNHQLVLVKAALEKTQKRVGELEELFVKGVGVSADAFEHPAEPLKRPQIARQVAPGLNGNDNPARGSESV